MPPITSKASLFSDLDPHRHAAQRRKYAPAYSMTSLVRYELFVNECTSLLAGSDTTVSPSPPSSTTSLSTHPPTSDGPRATAERAPGRVYGPDADVWRLERWLEIEADRREAEVERYFFAFGIGSRTCIRKNISLLEISKLVPQLLRRFDLVLDEELSRREWRTLNRWFVKPLDFRGRVISRTRRKGE
ncbi:hypothetical protein V8E51_005220 [Hyaloscypha variabilis]